MLLLACPVILPAQSSRPGYGSTPYTGGVTFRVWAPNATTVYVPGQFNSWSTTATPLAKELTNGVWQGVWSVDVSGALTNQQYKYYINSTNGSAYKHDPQSRWATVAGAGGNDIIYNPTNFNWNNDSLTPPDLSDLFIYELHIGTFPSSTSPNRFVAATNKLDYLKSLGVNAVEVMPIAEFGNTGTSWGYDPAQIYAVDNSQYGGPDAFKTFVKACHLRGLAVLLDVVHNHYGPSDLDMWDFDGWSGPGALGGGIYFNQVNTNVQITPWGDTRPDFASSPVFAFVQGSFTMWLNEYHVDGFRWDAPSAITTDNAGNYITAGGNLINSENAFIHTNYPGKISIAEDLYDSFGFDTTWDTSYPYSFTPVLTNTIDANRSMTTIEDDILYNVRYGGTSGFQRVAFLESHDVVGDLNDGVRVAKAIDPVTPGSYRARKLSTLGSAITFTAPGVPMLFQGQEMLESNAFDSGLSVDWTKTNTFKTVVQFYHDLINVRRDQSGYTPGLEGDQCLMDVADNYEKLIAFHRWKSSAPAQVAEVIGNFSSNAIVNYSVKFPSVGPWYVQLNSDSTNYGSDYTGVGSVTVTASGNPASASVTIGPYSALILSPTPPTPPPLSMTATNGNLSVTWPSAYANWFLFTASSLASPLAWSAVPAADYQTNGANTLMTIPQPGNAAFFCLQKGPD